MKATKIILAISDLWNDNQRICVRNCLLRGVEEVNKKFDINDLIEELNAKDMNKEIELETCIVQTLIDVDKSTFLRAIQKHHCFERLLIIYVGPVNAPWGQWLLRDGIINATDVMQLMNNAKCKLIMATLAPCDDWLITEKKHPDSISVCSYDMTECGDPIALALSDFVDSLCRHLKVSPCSIAEPDLSLVSKVTQPSISGFLDCGDSVMPCLFQIDGFSMLLNVGYGRQSEISRYLGRMGQIDAALLTHIGYGNILPLSCNAHEASHSVRISHMFLPGGITAHDRMSPGPSDSDNPYIVDLSTEISAVLARYKEQGTTFSNLIVKGKSAAPLSPNQLKPIPLFHKIGYGSLELICLSPFEEDAEVKKCGEDLWKGKYASESQCRTLPSSISVLLLWRPFNAKMTIKRVMYIGSRSALRKTLPAVISTLYSSHECLKQAHYSQWEASTRRSLIRKTQGSKPAVTKTNEHTSTEPSQKKIVALIHGTEKTVVVSDSVSKKTGSKPPRPGTATTAQKTKDASQVTKRPNSGATRPSKTDATKSGDVKKSTGKNNVGSMQTTKAPMSKGDVGSEDKNGGDGPMIVNGDKERCDAEGSMDPVNGGFVGVGTVGADAGKMMTVGTVECAITEHGEADFCDDSPEEYSAEQMKELGLYDDDEERSSAPISDRNDFDGGDEYAITSGNMAHLPMEGSFYGKDTFDYMHDRAYNWQPPLGMPVPTKDTGKKVSKCATPIHVDCVCVPSDIDKEDLRCLFGCVRARTVLLQGDRGGGDVCRSMDVLLDEWCHGDGGGEVTVVVPSVDLERDEGTLAWTKSNEARLASCKVRLVTALSPGECLIYRCDL